ncbi:MAG: hypothetical protein M3417_16315, partial [Actinomycetota bacterium]|nr:hypothetical protein [Actinomycetota bacterium]
MPDSLSSPTLLLTLERLDKTDGKALLKSSVKELIARGVLRIEAREEQRRLRRSRQRLLLVDGPQPPPPDRTLAGVARMIAGAPSEVSEGRVVRDLAEVAKHLARQPDVRKVVVGSALSELAAAGLVATGERRVFGLVKRTVHTRTPAGETVLEEATGR